MQNRKRLAALGAAVALTGFGSAQADGTSLVAVAAAPSTGAMNRPWAERVALSGDVRYRFQATDTEGLADQPRQRHRVRARVSLDATVNDEIAAGMRLATGTDRDPQSANQTLTGAADDKDVWFERAFIDWTPGRGAHVLGGKMAMPWQSVNDLVHSCDYNPEGLAATCVVPQGGVDLLFSGYYMLVTERSAAGDTAMQGAQAAVRGPLGALAKFTTGASLFNYNNIEGYGPFYLQSFGNRTTTVVDAKGQEALRYSSEFNEVEGFAELVFPFRAPVTLSAQVVVNTASKSDDAGVLYGAALGKLAKPGSYALTYTYRRLDPDAVFDVFAENTDTGIGADIESHMVTAACRVRHNTTLKVSYSTGRQHPDADEPIDVTNVKVEATVTF
jgi:hypothetical protein